MGLQKSSGLFPDWGQQERRSGQQRALVRQGSQQWPRGAPQGQGGKQRQDQVPWGTDIKEVCWRFPMRLKAFVSQVGSGDRLSGLVAVGVAHGQ